MKLIDTHSHLYSRKFEADQAEVITRAQAINDAVFLPNVDVNTLEILHALTDLAPGFFFPMMGLHPCDVKEDFVQQLSVMEEWFDSGKYTYYGIGETGLDLYWDKTTLDIQREALKIQIEWAKKRQLPIILHARNAIDETLEMIEKNHDESLWGIFHCFDGTVDQAKRIVALGNFKLGIGGIVTYKKSVLPSVLSEIGLNHLVLETDSPYLPPEPHRGKRNESSYTQFVAKKLAEIFEVSVEEVARITGENARQVFRTAAIFV
ncbi:MAG: TatD family hydrolase [Bacteroidia bacterium]|nr:TatD family hydrolase [Bacteroidia bacterium]